MENKYENFTLSELEKEANDYFFFHRYDGGTNEFDKSINDISRAMIIAYQQEHGCCYLGKVNLYEDGSDDPDYHFTLYTGQKIYNFEFDLVLPCEDEELRLLIVAHNNTHKKVMEKMFMDNITKIFNRLHEIGGISLTWV